MLPPPPPSIWSLIVVIYLKQQWERVVVVGVVDSENERVLEWGWGWKGRGSEVAFFISSLSESGRGGREGGFKRERDSLCSFDNAKRGKIGKIINCFPRFSFRRAPRENKDYAGKNKGEKMQKQKEARDFGCNSGAMLLKLLSQRSGDSVSKYR
ncbi:hypothetical protein CEXT_38831 [Caerostris extrusa]|uniref:Uncharacterized protein n=1 Tax=Caerostris extrusa TaxID=172846 RepID=A0AAV4NZM8_CAEEX|nr:hypothetical protein CEXT_38831 [Caerostris extrusa]